MSQRSILLLVLWLLALAAPARAQPLEIRQALSAQGDSTSFPVAAPARMVALPDEWARSRPGSSGPVWYRLRLPPVDHAGAELLALYVEHVCSTMEVQLNGQRVQRGARMHEPLTNDCNQPQLVTLPAALLQPGANTLDIKVAGLALAEVGSRQRAGGISAVRIGTQPELAALHARYSALQVWAPQAVSATLALMGSFMFVLGFINRRESHLAYFGALSIGWALITARLWWQGSGLPNYDSELLLVAAIPLITFAAVQFLLHYAGRRSRPIEVALVAQCAIVPASLLLAGPLRVHMMASSWYVLLAVQVLAALVFYLHTTRRERPHDFWPMLGVLGGIGVMVGIELAAQQHLLPTAWRVLPTLAMPLGFLCLGVWLVHQYGRALQTAEDLKASLETRVREATAIMERGYAQMAEARVEQVTQQERKRIAADLHDDLGAKLLTIVHTSESERISTLAREALEEMRLSVRGLTGKPVKLIDALGDWRAEVVGRLSHTGVEGDWQAPGEEDLPQTLSARAYVQTTRILREAVNNIIKHSGASRCSIRCTISSGDFQLKIQDNGKGIPLELDGRLDRGHGMSSMKHRAKQLQGQCLVESGPGYGTVIRLTIPLEKHTLPA